MSVAPPPLCEGTRVLYLLYTSPERNGRIVRANLPERWASRAVATNRMADSVLPPPAPDQPAQSRPTFGERVSVTPLQQAAQHFRRNLGGSIRRGVVRPGLAAADADHLRDGHL